MKLKLLAGSLLLALFTSQSSYACTDFRLTAKDGTVMITRSMEYAVDMQSNLRSSPRGRNFTTVAPNGKPGLSWKAKYGYVFLDAFKIDLSTDGMNEAGLSFEALYMPGFAKYQDVPAGQDSQALPYINIGDWVLSNFKTVDEVRQALTNIYVYQGKLPGHGDIVLPLHFSVFDATGKGIVIEYTSGKLHIYDNKIGVMTNSPEYSWHLSNLDNYVYLKPTNPVPVVANGETFSANGQGSGMIGLPGDISPPSRFVKISVLKNFSLPQDDAKHTLNLAEHIINNVDIPKGLVREPQSGRYLTETTEWVVFKDLTHRVFYYRTYEDTNLKSVDLSKVDFSENAPRLMMPIAGAGTVNDVTDMFLQAKS